MLQVEIIVGSVLGATEYVADAIAAVCPEIGLIANVHFSPNLADINLDAPWIVCSSTHGAGDLPDNIHAFHKQLQDSTLANPFLVVGLGDSSYDTYCQGAQTLYDTLLRTGANALQVPYLVDVLHNPIPEDVVVAWITPYLTALATNEA